MVPELIEEAGHDPRWRPLTNDAEYIAALLAKIVEEATELQAARLADRLDELADLSEVIAALMDALQLSADQLEEARNIKNAAAGAFTQRVWLESVVTR